MKIKQLECFIACVHAGSFTKATELLFLNQSNISRIIQGFEAELGTTLFLRSNKGLVLTVEGERVYKKALEIMDNVNQLENKAKKRPLEKFSVATFPSNFISFIYSQMCMNYSQDLITFKLQSKGTSEVLQQVEKGGADIGFIYSSQKQNLNLEYILRKRNLTFTPLCYVLPCIYLGQKNSLCDSSFITLEQMHNLKFMKTDYDYLENYFDLIGTVKHYGLEEQLNLAYIIDGGYGMTQMLNTTDICYLGHVWLKQKTGGIVRNKKVTSIYENFFTLNSYDGEIQIGYVLRKGQEKTTYIWEFLSMLCDEFFI